MFTETPLVGFYFLRPSTFIEDAVSALGRARKVQKSGGRSQIGRAHV